MRRAPGDRRPLLTSAPTVPDGGGWRRVAAAADRVAATSDGQSPPAPAADVVTEERRVEVETETLKYCYNYESSI